MPQVCHKHCPPDGGGVLWLAGAGVLLIAAAAGTAAAGVAREVHAVVHAVVPVVLAMLAIGCVFGGVALCRTLARRGHRPGVTGSTPGRGPQERARAR